MAPRQSSIVYLSDLCICHLRLQRKIKLALLKPHAFEEIATRLRMCVIEPVRQAAHVFLFRAGRTCLAGWCLLKDIVQWQRRSRVKKIKTHTSRAATNYYFIREAARSHCMCFPMQTRHSHIRKGAFVKNSKNRFLRMCAPHYATHSGSLFKNALVFFFNMRCFLRLLWSSIFACTQYPHMKFALARAEFSVCRKMCSQVHQVTSMLPHSCN